MDLRDPHFIYFCLLLHIYKNSKVNVHFFQGIILSFFFFKKKREFFDKLLYAINMVDIKRLILKKN
jgi:hypothetical protein